MSDDSKRRLAARGLTGRDRGKLVDFVDTTGTYRHSKLVDVKYLPLDKLTEVTVEVKFHLGDLDEVEVED